jgi:MFS family permease
MTSPPNQPNRPFAANIPRFFAYSAFKGFGFGLITAMWLIYLQQRRGLSLTQATFVDVAFWIAATLGEVPTGVVADTFGRKTSLVVGAAIMTVSILVWAATPLLPLIVLAYAGLALGTTFMSGADDALFYESVQNTGRPGDYVRLAGQAGAVMLGATAVGSAASGLFASVDLILPFLVAGASLLAMLVVAATFKETQVAAKPGGPARLSYPQILRQSLSMMRAQPGLRYPMLYLALVPIAAVIMETFFLQPQAIALGVPIAAVGFLVMAMQLSNMAGSTWAGWIAARLGESPVLVLVPALVVLSLIVLAAFQIPLALLCFAVLSFVTAVARPLVLNRIQGHVTDAVRATILSMQSLLATLLVTVAEPVLGSVADHSGLSAAYVALGGGLGLLVLCLLWISRQYFPQLNQ